MQTILDIPALNETLSFYVEGKAQTAGSKRPIAYRRRDGSIGARAVEGADHEAMERKRAWRTSIQDAARAAMSNEGWVRPEPTAAIALTVLIARRRPSGHMGTGRNAGLVKPWAVHARPVARPDSLKIVRAVEDALTGVAWVDDSAVCHHEIDKVFGDQLPGGSVYDEGVHVSIALL